MLSNYSAFSLMLLAPLLLGTELAVAATQCAARGSVTWCGPGAQRCALSPELLRWRRRVQASRRARDSELLDLMVAWFQTPLLDSPFVHRVNRLNVLYRAVLLRILRAAGR